jgi:hypothetical protein
MRLNTIEEINAYYEGKQSGIWLFAHWKDGRQYVGTCGTLLSIAINEAQFEQQKALKELQEGKEIYTV